MWEEGGVSIDGERMFVAIHTNILGGRYFDLFSLVGVKMRAGLKDGKEEEEEEEE